MEQVPAQISATKETKVTFFFLHDITTWFMPPLFLTAEASGADESDKMLRTHSWRRLGKSAKSGGSSPEKFCFSRDLHRSSWPQNPSRHFVGERSVNK